MWRSPSSPQIYQKYIYMWNNSCRTPTEHWQKTTDFQKGKKIHTYLGKAKEKRKKKTQKNRDGTCTSGRELWRRKSFHTLGSPFTRDGGWRGGSFRATEESTATGVQRAKRRDSHTEDGANQHTSAWDACLLTRWGGWGLETEARASEVRSQREDWGWRREHSLKGARAPQLAWREYGK